MKLTFNPKDKNAVTMDIEEALTWLKKNKPLLRIRAIETYSGIPESTLKKVLGAGKALPDRWHIPLSFFVAAIVKIKPTDIDAALTWLSQWQDFLRIMAIEVEAGIPSSSLKRVLTGVAPLAQHWHESLIKVIDELVKVPE